MRFPPLLLPAVLLLAGVIAGRFVWPRQRGITTEEIRRVDAAWSSAAQESGLTEAELTKRPADPALAKTWDFLQRLEKTPAAEFPAFWKELQEQGKADQNPDRKYSVEEMLLAERWAELDPEAALDFFAKTDRQVSLISIVFRVWSRMNAETALAAIAAENDEGVQRKAIEGVFSAAAGEPATLIAWGRRLAWLDGKQIDPDRFDRIIPPDALRRAFEYDPGACRELAANLPPWFRQRLEALAALKEAATDLPAALVRIDAAGLTKDDATRFLMGMLPLAKTQPDKMLAIMEHLREKLGASWMRMDEDLYLQPLLLALAKAVPDRIHDILASAARNDMTTSSVQAAAAAALFETDPRAALQLAPGGTTWMNEFLSGRLLPPGASGSPQETLELVRGAPSSMMRDSLLHDALSEMLKTSPEGAAGWIDSLPADELQNAARATVANIDMPPVWADLERAAASDNAKADPVIWERIRTLTLRAARTDPELTSSQITAWPDGPERIIALQEIGKLRAGENTPDALTWAESLPDTARSAALAGIMQEWAGNEPAAASEYIAALPGDAAQRDAPVSAFAKSLSKIDPEASLQWAATVQDPALRSAAVNETLKALFAADASAARKTLLSVPGLTPAERQPPSNPPAPP